MEKRLFFIMKYDEVENNREEYYGARSVAITDSEDEARNLFKEKTELLQATLSEKERNHTTIMIEDCIIDTETDEDITCDIIAAVKLS